MRHLTAMKFSELTCNLGLKDYVIVSEMNRQKSVTDAVNVLFVCFHIIAVNQSRMTLTVPSPWQQILSPHNSSPTWCQVESLEGAFTNARV